MCEAKVYKISDNKENKIMDDVYILKCEDDKLYFLNIFGEQELIKGNIKEIDLISHKITVE